MSSDIVRDDPGRQSFLCPHTIGRVTEIALLRQALADPDGSAVLLIGGEAGTGKSRLAGEARAIADALAFRSVRAHCYESDRHLPFAPARDLLAALHDLLGPDELNRRAGAAIAELAPLLPRTRPWPQITAREASASPVEERRRFFDAMARLLGTLAADQPLLVVIEDLHWSDDAGLDLLLDLTRRAAGPPLRLLLTFRADEIHPALAHLLAELDRRRLAVEIRLPRLGPSEVEAMLRAIFAIERPIPADLLHLVYTLTDGNPFFVEEVLKLLSLSGTALTRDGEWQRPRDEDPLVPRSVQDTVRRRLDLLTPATRQIATLAAVAGRRFDFDLLLELTQGDEPTLITAIKELIDAQLVVEDAPDRFAFRHALTRQAIAAGLLDRERRALHRRVAEALERRAGLAAAPPDELADQFARAGIWERALHYARLAGERARALDAPSAAAAHFSRAIEAAARLGRAADPALYQARGAVYDALGEFEHARADYEAARDHGGAAGDGTAEVEALLALGLLWSGRDYAQARAHIEAALDRARAMEAPALHARCLNRLGNWWLNQEQPATALRFHREALAAAEATGDQRLLAETLDLLGLTSALAGEQSAGMAYLEQAVARWRALGDRYGLLSSVIMLTAVGPNYHTDTLPAATSATQAAQTGEEAVRLAQVLGWRSGEAWARWTLGGLALAGAGDYGRALPHLRAGLALAEEIEHRQWITGARCMLGNLLADLFAWEEARAQLQAALDLARETDSRYWIRSAAGFLALVEIGTGDLAAAAAIVARDWSPETPLDTLPGRVLWGAAAEIALAGGMPDLALERLDRLVRSAPNPTGRAIPRLELLRGHALVALGRGTEAERALRAAEAAATALDAKPLRWRIQLSFGRLLLDLGRRDEADVCLAAAQTLIAALAAPLPDEWLRATFQQATAARFPAPPRRTPRQAARDAFGGLTEREREIAALLVAGRTNREIAAAISVSEWTVATHVRNILAKLDLRSRTQVATWAVTHGLSEIYLSSEQENRQTE